MQNVHKVFGAPGCGKTFKLMEILTNELKTVDPDKIAFVSFTKKGTYEGAKRAMELFNYKEEDLPYFRTLHSIAFRTGGFTKQDMIDRHNYKDFSDAMGMKFSGYYSEEFFNNDDRYLFMHFLARNNPMMATKYSYDLNARVQQDVTSNFERFKLHEHVNDFTDLIERFIKVGEALPVKVAIIDEAQDLTTLQWLMCEVAFKNCERVYVAGDDDQAIYEWSGADVNYFLRIKADQTTILNQSYRLQRNILEASQKVVQLITERVQKQFKPLADEGNIYTYNTLDSLPDVGKESWYFLSRNNYFLNYYRELLRKRALVFMDKDEPSFDKRELAAINAYEAARTRGKLTDIEEVKLKLFLKPNANMKAPWFESLNLKNDIIAYYRDLIKYKTPFNTDKLMVNTIHGVKGGEADNVVLMLDCTKAVRRNIEFNLNAELRVLYVGMTRAKKTLHVVYSSSHNGFDSLVRL